MKLADFLVDMVKQQASDLFISVDAPPMINVEGRMTALNDQVIDEPSAHELIRSILDESSSRPMKRTWSSISRSRCPTRDGSG